MARWAPWLLLLAPGSAALRARAGDGAGGRNGSRFGGKPYRVEMKNHWDLQYIAPLSVGRQTMHGIFDTGSFDLVVFSKDCAKCGKARAYDASQSKHAKLGKRSRKQNYGSGSCTSIDATDEVKIGDAVVRAQDMWVAQTCEMPLLGEASFTAIVGLGPPGRALKLATKKSQENEKLVARYKHDGLPLPPAVQESIKHNEEDLEDANKKKELLRSLSTKTLSACYSRRSGAPGWMIWNDITRNGQPGVKRVPVVGVITWGVKVGEVGLVDSAGKEMGMSCQGGCGAIMDTGTSLLGVPSMVYAHILDILAPDDGETLDCTHFDSLPRLLLTLGDEKFYLPPSAYVGQMTGGLNSNAVGFMRYTKETARQRCSLLLMDMGSKKTQFGPMFILGLPFFRYYYTTFDLGEWSEDRALFVSPSNNECEPTGEAHLQHFREDLKPMMVDASKIRVPDWLKSVEDHVI